MDWSKSGRKDYFRFEMIDPLNLDASRGELTGVKPDSCNITFGYYTDLKISGSVSFDDAAWIDNSLLRVYYVAELGGEITDTELATMFCDESKLTYDHGKCSGELTLYSTLRRYEEDLIIRDMAVSSGISAIGFFKECVMNAGGTPLIYPHLLDSVFTSPIVYEFGSKIREVMQGAAEFLGCVIGVDSHGRTTLLPYQNPSRKSVSYEIPFGENSMTKIGVDKTSSRAAAVNRSIIKFEKDDITIYGMADIDPRHFSSFERCGRRRAVSETINEMSPETQQRADEIAEYKLAVKSSAAIKYAAEMYYQPIAIGDVVRFRYSDSPGIDIDGMVQQIDMQLSAGLPCKVIFDEVRVYGR